VQLGDLESLQALTRASTEMTLGEMRQLAVADPLRFTEDEYYALIRSKTASLMRTACELGALSGARGYKDALGNFGENLGMAFQIADDLLDYREGKETTGKPSGLDLREHKVTLPLIHALREMSGSERRAVERLFASEEVSDEEFDRTFKTNVYAYFRLARAALKHMKPGSAIIATSSETSATMLKPCV